MSAAPEPGAPVIGEGAQVGADVRLGAFVVVHPGTVIGDGCEIGDHVVLGKPPRVAPHSRSSREERPCTLCWAMHFIYRKILKKREMSTKRLCGSTRRTWKRTLI